MNSLPVPTNRGAKRDGYEEIVCDRTESLSSKKRKMAGVVEVVEVNMAAALLSANN